MQSGQEQDFCESQTVMVCGGAGYIGSHAVWELLTLGHQVVVLDNLSTGHIESINHEALKSKMFSNLPEFKQEILKQNLTQKLIFRNVDLKVYEQISIVMKEFAGTSSVMHFAAYSLVGESMTDPLKYYENNVQGAIQLLKAMRDNNIKNLIFSSTAAVYGEPKSVPITESSETIPINNYGRSKLMIEQIIKSTAIAHQMKFVVLRYFNVAGAHFTGEIGEDHQPETHLIPNVIKAALGQKDLFIFGTDYPTRDGTCLRDYIHIDDLISAHILSMNYLRREDSQCQTFNLGSKVGYTVLEVIDSAKRVTGKDFEVEKKERRAGDPVELVASSELIYSVIGWEAKKNMDDCIRSAFQWHTKNPQGYSTTK